MPDERPQELIASTRAAWIRLLLIVAALVFGGALLVFGSRRAPERPKSAFDPGPLHRVVSRRPDFVFIGNSMLGTRIHERTLTDLVAPRRVVTISQGGSRAAVWYLIFKNYVIGSHVPVKRVFIFFRYQELTEALYRDSGIDQWQIDRASVERDQLVSAKLFPPPAHPVKRLGWQLAQFAPVERLRANASEHTTAWFDRASTWFADEPDFKKRHQEMNAPFALDKLRGAAAVVPDGAFAGDFQSAVDGSFLPELLKLSKDSGIPVAFVRVRPRAVAEGRPESPEMRAYVADLRRYIEARGAVLIDQSGADWESADLYKNGDHLAPRFMPRYTRLFFTNLPQLFQ